MWSAVSKSCHCDFPATMNYNLELWAQIQISSCQDIVSQQQKWNQEARCLGNWWSFGDITSAFQVRWDVGKHRWPLWEGRSRFYSRGITGEEAPVYCPCWSSQNQDTWSFCYFPERSWWKESLGWGSLRQALFCFWTSLVHIFDRPCPSRDDQRVESL